MIPNVLAESDKMIAFCVEESTGVESVRRIGFRALSMKFRHDGGLAQLGERLHGMQEVRGSSPLSSILVFRSFLTCFLMRVSDAPTVIVIVQHGGCESI